MSALVRAASVSDVSNLNSNPATSIDGVTVADGDLVLLRRQTTTSENGVYRYVYVMGGTSYYERPTTAPSWDDVNDFKGNLISVLEGVENAGTIWTATTVPGAIGTGALLFTRAAMGQLNVLDFGADPTGETECSAAIQKAIDYANVTKGVVYFPIGEYEIGEPLELGNGGIRLEGAVLANAAIGAKLVATDTFNSSGGGPMITTDLSGMDVSSIQVVNLYLDCNEGAADTGLQVYKSTRTALFENISVSNANGSAFIFNDCESANAYRLKCDGAINGHGVELNVCNFMKLHDSSFVTSAYNAGKAGVYVVGGGSGEGGNVQLKNCDVTGSWAFAYWFDAIRNVVTADGCRSECSQTNLGTSGLFSTTHFYATDCGIGVALNNCFAGGAGGGASSTRLTQTDYLPYQDATGTSSATVRTTQTRIAQKFELTESRRIAGVEAKLSDNGESLVTTMRIETDDSGEPSGTVAGPNNELQNTTNYAWPGTDPVVQIFDDGASAALEPGTYWLVFIRQSGGGNFDGTTGTSNVLYYQGAGPGWNTVGSLTNIYFRLFAPNRFMHIMNSEQVFAEGCIAAGDPSNESWTQITIAGNSAFCRVENAQYGSHSSPSWLIIDDHATEANQWINRRLSHRSAMPSLGYWTVGDRLFNDAPAVGDVDYWVCTNAASIGGTWEPVYLSSVTPSTHASGTALDAGDASTAVKVSASVTIQQINNGYEGQVIAIFANGSSVAVQDQSAGGGRNIYLRGGATYNMAQNEILTVRRIGSSWYEQSRTAA